MAIRDSGYMPICIPEIGESPTDCTQHDHVPGEPLAPHTPVHQLPEHLEQREREDGVSAAELWEALAEVGIAQEDRNEVARKIWAIAKMDRDVRPVAALPRNVSIGDAAHLFRSLEDAEWLVLRGNPDGTVGIWTKT
jgi:hypothetical protein